MLSKLCGVETDLATFYQADEEEELTKKVQMSVYILSLNLEYACLQGVFGKEVGANDDEVLIERVLLLLLLPLCSGGGRLRGAQQDGGGGPAGGDCGGQQECVWFQNQHQEITSVFVSSQPDKPNHL